MGRARQAKALIFLALGRDGQQRAPAKTGSNPYLPAISHLKALEITSDFKGFFVLEEQSLQSQSALLTARMGGATYL